MDILPAPGPHEAFTLGVGASAQFILDHTIEPPEGEPFRLKPGAYHITALEIAERPGGTPEEPVTDSVLRVELKRRGVLTDVIIADAVLGNDQTTITLHEGEPLPFDNYQLIRQNGKEKALAIGALTGLVIAFGTLFGRRLYKSRQTSSQPAAK